MAGMSCKVMFTFLHFTTMEEIINAFWVGQSTLTYEQTPNMKHTSSQYSVVLVVIVVVVVVVVAN